MAVFNTSEDINNIVDAQLTGISESEPYDAQAATTEASAALTAAGLTSDAMAEAANLSYQATNSALDEQYSTYEEGKSLLMPWQESGEWALGELTSMMSNFDGSPDSYEQSPYYDFIADKSVTALDRSAAARGKLNSGAQQKAVMEYGKDLASTDYDNWLGRYYDSLQPYQSMANNGLVASQSIASLGANKANSVSNLLTNDAALQGSYLVGGAEAEGSGVLGSAGAMSSYYSTLGDNRVTSGDIRATGYVNDANINSALTDSLVEATATYAPDLIGSAYDTTSTAISDWWNSPSDTTTTTSDTSSSTGDDTNWFGF